MTVDTRELTEYPFDGVFYEYKTTTEGGLLNQKTEEIEVLRVKCDIQQTSQLGNAGFLASSYTIFFPLEESGAFEEGGSATSMIDDKTFKDVPIRRGMCFRGSIYGYEVNGKVVGVAPSMLGGCEVQIKDLDE